MPDNGPPDLSTFVELCCVLDPEAQVRFADLRTAYHLWSAMRGQPPARDQRIGRELAARGITGRDSAGQRWVVGIAPAPDARVWRVKATDTPRALLRFVSEHYRAGGIGVDTGALTPVEAFLEHYGEWAEARGRLPLSQHQVTRWLRASLGVFPWRRGATTSYVGLKRKAADR